MKQNPTHAALLAVCIAVCAHLFAVPSSAELRKRVLIDVHAPDSVTARLVEGTLSRELGRDADILVIDYRFEQTFVPVLKYKAHVMVQVDVVQMYADAFKSPKGPIGRIGEGVGNLVEWTFLMGTMGLGAIPITVYNSMSESEDDPGPRTVEGNFTANVGLFDMATGRTFARTQTTFAIKVKSARHDKDRILETRIAEDGLREAAKWIKKEVRRRPGQTWVFAEKADRAFVNAGSLDGLKEGQALRIYRPYPIYAPQTDIVVGLSAAYECDIKIIQLDELFSIAESVRHDLAGEYMTK